jgi:hypothetical protein
MGNEVETTVYCYSDYTYAQKPIAFLYNGERLEVSAIEAEWISPEGRGFKINTPEGRHFKLFYNQIGDRWQIIPT